MPRGGVKGKWKNQSRTDRVLCRESSPCTTRWREGKKTKKKKKKNNNKDSVGERLSNKFGISFFLFIP